MTREETIKLLMMVQATFPNFKVEDKSVTVDAWLMILEEYDVNEVYLAFRSYCKSNKSGFAPSVSQLVNELEKPKDIAQIDELTAWSMVRKAINRSSYNSQEEFDKLPPTIQKAVGSAEVLRTWAVDEKYNNEVVMSAFTKNYAKVCQRKRDFERLPNEMQLRIEQFVEKCPLLETGELLIGSTEKPTEPTEEVKNNEPLGTYTSRVKDLFEQGE